MRAALVGLLVAATGCDVVFGLDDAERLPPAPDAVVPGDEGAPDTTPRGWSPPMLLFSTSDTFEHDDPTLSSDLLELYFNRDEADIYYARRASLQDMWSSPTPVTAFSGAMRESNPELSRDGKKMFFASNRTGTLGGLDTWVSTRADPAASWSTPLNITAINSSSTDSAATPNANVTTLIFNSKRNTGAADLYEIFTSVQVNGMWTTPTLVMELSDVPESSNPMLSDDELTVYFDSTRGTGGNDSNLWIATRPNRAAEFTNLQPVAELNSTQDDRDPWISPDGTTLVFSSDRGGRMALWYSTRE